MKEEEIEIGKKGKVVELTKEEKAYVAFMTALSKQSGNVRPSKHRLPSGELATQTTLEQRRYDRRAKNKVAKAARKANR